MSSPRGLPPLHESWLPSEHPLYRPRHGRQRLARVCAVLFLFVPLVAYLAGVRPTLNGNHRPATVPAYAGWSFFTGLTPWASDNLAIRDSAIRAEDFVSRTIFGEPPTFGNAGDTGPLDQSGPPRRSSTSSNDAPTDGIPAVIQGTDNWLYYGSDMDGKCQPSQTLDQIVGNVETLKNAVERSGRRFVLIVAPDKTTMYPEHLPSSYPEQSCAAAASARFWQRMVSELGIPDLRPALRNAATEVDGPVYFPQDTHWNYAGGLTMARATAEQVQPDITSTWRTTLGPVWTGTADLPQMLGRSGTDRAIEYGLAPDGRTSRANFTPADFHQTTTYTTDPGAGVVDRPTALIGDSFLQFAYPYFAATFAHIAVTHIDTLSADPAYVAQSIAAADTVVFEVVERHLAAGISPISDLRVVNTISAAVLAHPVN